MKQFFTFFFIFSAYFAFCQVTETFITSGTFIVPAGVTTISVELWGAGGGGGNGSGRREGGGGGGYSMGTVNVTPGQTINYTVGTGAVNTTGGTTIFSTISATGGQGGFGQTSNGGAGGVGMGGTINRTGGTGGGVVSGNAGGGGGGGSATNAANGGNGGISTSTTGGAGGTGQGDGGKGADQSPSAPAQVGVAPGGGGGGRSSANSTAGAGARGEIKITYNPTFPISLSDFKANTNQKQVDLNWNKANAQNFDKFVVEHSVDGKAFRAIDEVNGRTGENFNYIHTSPALGTNYYRLKMMDLDGSYSYSAVVSAFIKSDKKWAVLPNQNVENEVRILCSDTNTTLNIVDMSGKIVFTKETEGNPESMIQVGHLPTGIYSVQFWEGSTLMNVERFVKK